MMENFNHDVTFAQHQTAAASHPVESPANLSLADIMLPPWTNLLPNTSTPMLPTSELPDVADNNYDTKYKAVYDVMNCYLTPLLCIFGFIGNFINVVVLTHRRFCMLNGGSESGSRIGLIVLALSDMLFCVVLFPRSFLYTAKSLFTSADFWLFFQAYGTGLITTFILSSTWITVALAMLRYLAICHPFRLRKLDGNRCSKIAYSIMFASSMLMNIPSFFQFQIMSFEFQNSTVYLIDIGYMDHRRLPGKIFQVFRLLFFLVFPLALLVFCNISLINALRKSQRIREQLRVPSHISNTKNRITSMLIIVSVSFLVLVLPSEIMDFFIEFVKMDYQRTEVFMLMRSVANLLQLIAFSCNFLIYCLCNLHFRKVVRDIVRCSNSGHARGQSFMSRHEFMLSNFNGSIRSSVTKRDEQGVGKALVTPAVSS
jgi:hypothetical protein